MGYNYADLGANPHCMVCVPYNEGAGSFAVNYANPTDWGKIEVHPSTWSPRGHVQCTISNPRIHKGDLTNIITPFPGEGWIGNKVDPDGLGHPVLMLYAYRVPQPNVLLDVNEDPISDQFFGIELGDQQPTHYHLQHNNHERTFPFTALDNLFFTQGFETNSQYLDTGIAQVADRDYAVACYYYHGDEAAIDGTLQPYFVDYRVHEYIEGRLNNSWSVDAAEVPTIRAAGTWKDTGGWTPVVYGFAPWNGFAGMITYGAQAFLLPIGSTRPSDFDAAVDYLFPRWVNDDKAIWPPWVNLGGNEMSGTAGTFDALAEVSDTLNVEDTSSSKTTKLELSLHTNASWSGTIQLQRRRIGDTAWRVVASYTDVVEEIKEMAGRWEVRLEVTDWVAGSIAYDMGI